MTKYHVRIYGYDERDPLSQIRLNADSRHEAVESALHYRYDSYMPPRYLGGYCDCWESHTTRDGHIRLWCQQSHDV